MSATTLYFAYVVCVLKFDPFASHTVPISKTLLRSKFSYVHFKDLVCWVLWVKFPCPLTLIHSKLSTLDIYTCLCIVITYSSHLDLVCPAYGIMVFHGYNQVYREP